MTTEIVGGVELNEVTIKCLNGNEFNLLAQLISINIYESIDNQNISADISIDDPFDWFTTVPFVGEEEITVEFRTPSTQDTEPTTYTFFVHDIVNMVIAENNASRRYTFRCSTKEFMINSVTLYSRRYDDKPENVVTNILQQELQTEKDIFVEEAKGTFDMLVSNRRPFQVIDLVTARAISNRYNSSFKFFENKYGYNFTTIEKLFVENREKIGDKEFFYELPLRNRIQSMNQRNILAFETRAVGSNLTKLRDASLHSITRAFDVITGSVIEYDYRNTRDGTIFETADNGGEEFNSSTFEEMFGERPARRFFAVRDSSRPENYHETRIGHKAAYNNRIAQFRTSIRVYGDTELSVGDVITLRLPPITGPNEDREEPEMINDNYMIYSLMHKIIRDERGFEHYTTCDLIKGNFGERNL